MFGQGLWGTIRGKLILVVTGAMTSIPTWAHYDSHCLELLIKTDRQAEAFLTWRRAWSRGIEQALGLGRPLSEIEFEVLMDIVHDLPVTIEFQNGHTDQFAREQTTLVRFRVWIRAFQILKVSYDPIALDRLGQLYKTACKAIDRQSCDVYDFYRGLGDPEARPLTPLEERALKWTTFHMMPDRSQVQLYRGLSLPTELVQKSLLRNEMKRKAAAIGIIMSVFGDEDGVQIYLSLVEPNIAAAYARLFRLYLGALEH